MLDQSAAQATTGSLVVVGVTSVIGAVVARREGNVLLGRGLGFALVAVLGAAAGAWAASAVADDVLLAAFSALMVVVGVVMAIRQIGDWRERLTSGSDDPSSKGGGRGPHEPSLLSFSPSFACRCGRLGLVVVTATAVGLLTGFLGVGGGFVVVPALLWGLGLSMHEAAGTSLVVIAIVSAVALVVRAGSGVSPDWIPVLVLTASSATAAALGARLAGRVDNAWLSGAFTVLVLVVAGYTAAQALPGLL
ncbi:MAG: TSUP family transporter [Nocardioides sp.]